MICLVLFIHPSIQSLWSHLTTGFLAHGVVALDDVKIVVVPAVVVIDALISWDVATVDIAAIVIVHVAATVSAVNVLAFWQGIVDIIGNFLRLLRG